MSHAREKLKEVFESTIESDLKYDGKIENIHYYELFCKAASKRKVFKLLGNDVCMTNYTYEGKDSILIVFFIPINSKETGAKTIAERVMQVVEEVETCFVTLDYLNSEEIKEDKFVYVSAVKCLKGE